MVGSEKHSSGRTIPAEATGQITLKVSAESNHLSVDCRPSSEQAEPRKEMSVDVAVKNKEGEPVGDAEVTLAVVDDS
ncbi:hypothetical protein ABTJ91_21035, partial [Acinetobacter baumannii]